MFVLGCVILKVILLHWCHIYGLNISLILCEVFEFTL